MTDIQKSIEAFLESNNLHETLRQFRLETKKTSPVSHQNGRNHQFQPLDWAKIPDDPQKEFKIREHFQRADVKHLKKFAERVKRMRAPKIVPRGKLTQLSFFKRLMDRETRKAAEQEKTLLKGAGLRSLDESVFYENEWESENDAGYDMFECTSHTLQQIVNGILATKDYKSTAIKEVPFPASYFLALETARTKKSRNVYDRLPSRLPSNARLELPDRPPSSYPIESEGHTFSSFDLKVIYDRQKTGFEEERELSITEGEILAGRYQIIGLLGQAQFSRAVEVIDLKTQRSYCLKIIQNNKDYMDQSMDEIKLLNYIKANCNLDESCILKLHDYFYHRQHLILVTELLKQNLYDAYKADQSYFSLSTVQAFAKQILTALQKMHSLHIIHSDLKPENILIKSYSNRLIKVIDVGSSVYFHDQPMFYVQTRSYRAPQVLLGCPFDFKIDIWSVGCILAEIFLGEVLFDSDSVVGLIALIQGLRGPWPSWMIEKGKSVEKFFTKELILFEEIQEKEKESNQSKSKGKTGKFKIFVPKMTNLKSRMKCSNKHFLDFLSKCLKIDPSARFSASEALSHPFITDKLED